MPSGALPAKIVIYRRPLEAAFPDPAELQRQIRITVLHELAHYFGYRRGPARRARLRLVDLALNAIAIIAGIVGAIVIVLFFFGGRD